jgi:hypothetical protein
MLVPDPVLLLPPAVLPPVLPELPRFPEVFVEPPVLVWPVFPPPPPPAPRLLFDGGGGEECCGGGAELVPPFLCWASAMAGTANRTVNAKARCRESRIALVEFIVVSNFNIPVIGVQ